MNLFFFSEQNKNVSLSITYKYNILLIITIKEYITSGDIILLFCLLLFIMVKIIRTLFSIFVLRITDKNMNIFLLKKITNNSELI